MFQYCCQATTAVYQLPSCPHYTTNWKKWKDSICWKMYVRWRSIRKLKTSTENDKWAVTCDFQQSGILTSVDSDEPLQPAFKLRNLKWCSVSSLTLIGYSRDKQMLWSDCTYAQADLRLCWLHIPHYWKSHAMTQMRAMLAFILCIAVLYLCMLGNVAVCWFF